MELYLVGTTVETKVKANSLEEAKNILDNKLKAIDLNIGYIDGVKVSEDKDIKKGDMVCYRDKKAKVMGVSVKGGKTKYKLKLNDGFNTIVYNIDSKEIHK